MFKNAAYVSLVSVFIFAIAAVPTFAQGIIIPRPCPPERRCTPIPRPFPMPSSLPVKLISFDTKINGQVATTTVTQVFENKSPYMMEGIYFFPIPEDSSVEQFAIWENGKKLVGEVRSREEARKIYDQIVRTMRDPGLLEYAGEDLFQASIFPIPGNSEKKLELKYSQILKAESGTVAYRYPLGKGKNLWMQQRAVPDGNIRNVKVRRGEEKSELGVVSGRIEIVGNAEIRNIYSPSHSIDVSKKGREATTVSFETKGDPSDFQLFYGLSSAEFGSSLMTYREPGKDGYFLFMVSPKEEQNSQQIVKKDVIFVLDTSGSMNDNGKIEKAKPALNFGIANLNSGDRFNVINFAGEEHFMSAGLIDADKAGKDKGRSFVEELVANGGTNINDALRAALKQFDSSERPKMLVFITDGLPTVGEQNVDKIIQNAKDVGVKGLRLFSFGVGYDVNTRLLDRLSTENSGLSDYIQPKEDIEIKVSNFFSKVNNPVISDVSLDFGSIKADLNYPKTLTDIFRGTQALIIGRYRNESDLKNAIIKMTGKIGVGTKTIAYSNLNFPLVETKNDFLPRLWASRRVGWLMESIRANGENKEVKDEIIELGTRYGIVTPYTSFLATDGTYNQLQRSAPVNAVVEVADESGRNAVELSATQNSMKSNSTIRPRSASDLRSTSPGVIAAPQIFVSETSENQFVGAKNFLKEKGNWIDAEYSEGKKLREIQVKFGSNEYFEIINKERQLAKYFAIGKNVIVVWDNKVYRVTE